MKDSGTTTIRAAKAEELPIVRELFLEYAQSLGFSLCFQGFDEELATLPGKYVEPHGILLLALVKEQPVGVVGLRPLEVGVCEMKRLYVKPEERHLGVGQLLVVAILEYAKRQGYSRMRLDTLPNMEQARRLYEKFGFVPIAPYYDNSPCGSICMEMRLSLD